MTDDRPTNVLAGHSPDEPPVSGMILNRYRVDGFLGKGRLGTVIMAFDTRFERQVAIKSLRYPVYSAAPGLLGSLEDGFECEAEAGSRMGIHPNLVTVHDLVTDTDKTLYLILEYVSGGTLAGRINKEGPLPLDDALRITAETARGLQTAHDAGIVHRDIKPANIFLAGDGRAQVGDFSVAQIDDLTPRTKEEVGHPGTPLYMSPEQATIAAYLRPASDQYSLGLVLFEMLTGTAYRRLTPDQQTTMLLRALARSPRTAQSIPIQAIVERMTAIDSGERYESLKVVASVLTPGPWSPIYEPTVGSAASPPPLYAPPSYASPAPTGSSSPMYTPPPVYAPAPPPPYPPAPGASLTSRRLVAGVGILLLIVGAIIAAWLALR